MLPCSNSRWSLSSPHSGSTTPPEATGSSHFKRDFVRQGQVHPDAENPQKLQPDKRSHLIETCNDLVEQAETVNALVLDLFFLKIFVEAGNGRKHDANLVIGLGVQLLRRVQITSVLIMNLENLQ